MAADKVVAFAFGTFHYQNDARATYQHVQLLLPLSIAPCAADGQSYVYVAIATFPHFDTVSGYKT